MFPLADVDVSLVDGVGVEQSVSRYAHASHFLSPASIALKSAFIRVIRG